MDFPESGWYFLDGRFTVCCCSGFVVVVVVDSKNVLEGSLSLLLSLSFGFEGLKGS